MQELLTIINQLTAALCDTERTKRKIKITWSAGTNGYINNMKITRQTVADKDHNKANNTQPLSTNNRDEI